MNGLVVLNKPAGVTSRKMVDRALEWFPGERAGHAGTLDPMATGVLVVCIGPATRLIEYVQRMGKTYSAGVRLGAWSETDDAEGTIHPVDNAVRPSRQQVAECLQTFVGEIEQTPPAYSAAHVAGRRAYRLARKGQDVALAPRLVRIHRIDLIHYEYPRLDLVIDCGKGTYIRSVARDLGRRLGCGGYLERLQRSRVGPFTVEQAVSFDTARESVRDRLLPARLAVSELPGVSLSDAEVSRLRQGQRLPPRATIPRGDVALFDEKGELAGIGRADHEQQVLRPFKML